MDDISQLNLRVLNKHNPYITSLIDKSSYCVVYTFSIASASWTKAGYEGTLFIYSQQSHTIQTEYGEEQGGEYGFCVLNRLSLDNFWGEINGGDIVLEDQYIITRSLTGEVYGLWLFEGSDRERIYSVLNHLNSRPRLHDPMGPSSTSQANPISRFDISSLLDNAKATTQKEEPQVNGLPSVDRLTELFNRALASK